MQVLKNNEFEFVEIPFELSNADTVDKDIGNRYTKSTENIIYISQNLYQKSSINVFLMTRINQMSIS